jgi:PAS domain-containing protein
MIETAELSSRFACPCAIEVLATTVAALLLAGFVACHTWRHYDRPESRLQAVAALCLVAGLAVWFGFAVMASLFDVSPALWAVPLDRLVGTVILAGLAWGLVAPQSDNRHWGRALVALMIATIGMFAIAGPAWAMSRVADDAEGFLPSVVRAWEGVELALALVLLRSLQGRAAPRWLIALFVTLGAGSVLQLAGPSAASVPVWSNMATVLASCVVAGSVALRGLPVLRPERPPRSRRRRAMAATQVNPAASPWPIQEMAPSGGTAVPTGRPGLVGPATVADSTRDSAAVEPARLLVGRIGFAPPPEESAAADRASRRDPRSLPAAIVVGETRAEARGDPEPVPAPLEPCLGPLGGASPATLGRARQALDCLTTGVLIADADDRIVVANRAAEHLLHREHLCAGMNAPDVFPAPERAELALHRVRRSFAAGSGPVAMDFSCPALSAEVAPLGEAETGYSGAFIMLHPAAAVATGTSVSLVPALAAALRAPMASILAYSELLGTTGSLGADRIDRYVARIDANLGRMQTLLDNLLTVAEMIDLLDPGVPQKLQLEDVLHAAVDRAKPQMCEKSVSVRVDTDPPLPPVSADPDAVRQIVDSLLACATARSPQGGEVTASARTASDADDQRAVVLSVRDYGRNPLSGATGFVQLADLDASQPSLAVVQILAARQGGHAWAEVGPNCVDLNVRLPVAVAA